MEIVIAIKFNYLNNLSILRSEWRFSDCTGFCQIAATSTSAAWSVILF